MDHQVQLEAEEPALGRLAEVGPVFSEQQYPSMAQRVAQRKRFTIKDIEPRRPGRHRPESSRFDQVAYQRGQPMEALEPLLVAAQLGEGRPDVVAHDIIGGLECVETQSRLHQRDGDHLGIGQWRLIVVRVAPGGGVGMSFHPVIDEDVDFGSEMVYTSHGLVVAWCVRCVVNCILHTEQVATKSLFNPRLRLN